MTPTVSIITPTYDRLQLLLQTVASVRAQRLEDWDLVIVDDGSTDGTGDHVAGLGDERIRLVTLSHVGNVARARNAGLKHARGDYVAFLDSDDLWLPEKLALQMAEMERAGVGWSYTGFEVIDPDGQPLPPRAGHWKPLAGRILEQVLTTEAAVGISTLMVERDLLERVGPFDEDPTLNFREDYELVLRLAAAAEAGVVDAPLVRVREHPNRSTHARDDGFQRTARVYEVFLAGCEDPALARIARRRRGRHLAEAAARRMGRAPRSEAGRLYLDALWGGDDLGHWLKAVYRGVRGCFLGWSD